MAASKSDYAERLDAALKLSGLSARQLAKELAARTGNAVQDERSAIYRYKKTTEPTPERAALLADILDAPYLRTVTPIAEKRNERVRRLEDEVRI